jgi:dCTP deaminase
MILTGAEIKKRIDLGDITIKPFIEKNLGPNSYDITLNNKLKIYTDPVLDVRLPPNFVEVEIPEAGLILKPGMIYIGATNEYIEVTSNIVPILYGRSSIGRLGLAAHMCSGFGDLNFKGIWTLGLVATQPIKIYPNIRIGQICFNYAKGELGEGYSGKYQNATDSIVSKSSEDK